MDKNKFWQTILSELQIELSPPVFNTWFASTRVVNLDNQKIIIGCPNSYTIETIKTRFLNLLKEKIGKKLKIEFVVINASQKNQTLGPLFNQIELSSKIPLSETKVELSSKIPLSGRKKETQLNPHFCFTNFAVASSNQLAFAAASAVAQNPGKAYNPLFIYGGVGVGKTHLMQAVGNAILEKYPQKKVFYCMGEDFTNEIIDAIRNKTTKNFKDRYRNIDTLLLDDVQFIAGKTAVQEEFFHTFNALYRNGKQIILVSDRPPQEIKDLEERLRSRFEGGLIADVAEPDSELRSAILLIKCEERGIELSREIITFIAEIVNNNRQLEGILSKLMIQSELKKSEINLNFVKDVLEIKSSFTKKQKVFTPKEVIVKIAENFNLKPKEIIGPRRKKEIVLPRQLTMYFLRTVLGIQLEKIGEILGKRDHTTVMHGVDKIEKLLRENHELKKQYDLIYQNLT